ncbi:hypothetical protein HanPSC8_Chr05g0210891 [Helianthus annuus]|nr:hypothetical protein HanPSC8_Chr05g0210891 [Helianthus annuus]
MIKKYTVFVKRDHGLGGKHGRSKKFGESSKLKKMLATTWWTLEHGKHSDEVCRQAKT